MAKIHTSAICLPLNISVATVRRVAYTLLSQDSGGRLGPERGRCPRK